MCGRSLSSSSTLEWVPGVLSVCLRRPRELTALSLEHQVSTQLRGSDSGALLSSRRLLHLFGDSVLHGAVQSPALPNLPQQVCLLHVCPFSRAAVHHRNRRTGLADKAVCQATTALTEVRFAAAAQSKVAMRGFPVRRHLTCSFGCRLREVHPRIFD